MASDVSDAHDNVVDAHIPEDYPPNLFRIRHSCAHIMAQAVRERFGEEGAVALATGPAIENGFYYDFQLPRPAREDDLTWIEKRMKAIIKGRHAFEKRVLSHEEARALFQDEPLKLEVIEGLLSGNLDDHGEPQEEATPVVLTAYQHDSFVDLCAGPHVENTREIDPRAIKLLSVAGAYWRGNEKGPMLQRIYGTAWSNKKELKDHLWRLEEAAKRDHRKLGKELELFHFDPSAPGMPYWLPKGFKVLNLLIDYWRQEHERRGYQEISTPLINEKSLWETSGHWEHYKENMFIAPVSEHVTYGVKPMNCPNAMVVYNVKKRSYRELPLRLSDCDPLHRHERSGTLHGLFRVQSFQQDDAHIFIHEGMIEEEYARILDIAEHFYALFDLKYTLRLGTRPEDYIGDLETWDRAEAALKTILERHAGAGNYKIREGDGAFYGPKIDILMEDALGRSWQTGTIQLDFQLPRRFGCKYTDSDGQEKTPVVVHRVIYGSLERFLGILIEHTGGAFPVWLAPVQAMLIPITDRNVDYCRQVKQTLRDAGIRAELDDSDIRMNAKIRSAQLQKIPYMLVVGDREMEAEAVAIRLRTNENLGAVPVADFIARVQGAVADKKSV